jgi:N-formylglutamate deformylase
MKPFFISVPHAGEKIPPEATWLKDLVEPVLMCDVDRYVDQLYRPAATTMGVPIIIAETHRYVVDLNRVPEDVDQNSVEESLNPPGKFTSGFHWSQTTTGAPLIKEPISKKFHQELTEKYYRPFHNQIQDQYSQYLKNKTEKVYHLDAHSMPSMGTSAHRDPGQRRAEIVVSDCDGKSCDEWYKNLVVKSYQNAGFEVNYNWPYKGGRITEMYGNPRKGQNAIQVEMNRALYMDEVTKKKNHQLFDDVAKRVVVAIGHIVSGLSK